MSQVLAHTVFLVFVPFCTYLSTFVVHYQVLSKSGPGDGFHTSAFQSCLQGKSIFGNIFRTTDLTRQIEFVARMTTLVFLFCPIWAL